MGESNNEILVAYQRMHILFCCHLTDVMSHKKVITDSSNLIFQNVKARISPASSFLTKFAINTLYQVSWNFHFCMVVGTKLEFGTDMCYWAVSKDKNILTTWYFTKKIENCVFTYCSALEV